MADPTKLDVSTPAPTRLDNASAAPTLLDSGAAPSPHIHVQLPPALAARFRIERQFPAHGAEADVLLVWPLTGAGRVVLKLYRPGIRPKTDVLERIARAAPEHVIQLYEHGQADGVWYEILEYAPHGSLRDLMHGPVAPEQTLAVLDELSAALGYLHSQQIIHRDLKPENVLIRRLQPLDLALTDFGIASVSEFSQHHTNLSRTVRYSAPEALSGVLSAKADWWSLGLVLLEMLGGKHPFDGLSDVVILHWLITRPIDVNAVTDPAWNTLCRGLLLRDPQQRWGLSEIQRWRHGENVAVASEHAPAVVSETAAQRPYKIGGESCFSAEPLGRALAQHWDEAVKHLERGLILDWVRDELKDQALASFVMDLAAENLPADEKLLKLLRQLAPSLPPVYRGIAISGEDLFKLAQQAAQGDNAAEELFWNMYERDILSYFQGYWLLQQIRKVWQRGVKDYQAGWETIIKAGAPSNRRPELRIALSPLFLALFSKKHAERLRGQIQIDDIVRRYTHWYLALGEAENVAREHLLILVGLYSLALEQAHTKAERITASKTQIEHFYKLLAITPQNHLVHPLLLSFLPLAKEGNGEQLHQELERPRIWPIIGTGSITQFQKLSNFYSPESIEFSPDGHCLAFIDGLRIYLWDINSGRELHTARTFGSISLTFSPNGRILAWGRKSDQNGEAYVCLYDLDSWKELRILSMGNEALVCSIAFSPDGQLLAAAGEDHTIHLWATDSGKKIRILTGHSSYVTSVVFFNNGRFLASGSGDNTVRLWEVDSGRTFQILAEHMKLISSVKISPDGNLLALASYDTVRLWSTKTYKVVRSLTLKNSFSVNSIAFSPDSCLLAIGKGTSPFGRGECLLLWNIKSDWTLQNLMIGEHCYDRVKSVSFSHDGCFLASGDLKSLILWRMEEETIENYLKKYT